VPPPVDVVVPFRGSRAALDDLIDRFGAVELGPRDTLTIVDNTRSGASRGVALAPPLRVVHAPDYQSSYFARDRGAEIGTGEWIVFLDADVHVPPDLIARYLSDPPDEQSAVLAGGVRDQLPDDDARESLAGRYARLRGLMDHENNLRQFRPYAKTANCAVRRTAFEAIGGFGGRMRSGGDADLCFRLAAAGWRLESCPGAAVDHTARRTLVHLLGQRARHGSGAEWLEGRYPGFAGPRLSWTSLIRNILTGGVAACGDFVRGQRDRALVRLMDPLSIAAFELGRRFPNLPWRELIRLRGPGDEPTQRA
jgi:Glycosyltransferase like family 2